MKFESAMTGEGPKKDPGGRERGFDLLVYLAH
jgi:hypothetical protein